MIISNIYRNQYKSYSAQIDVSASHYGQEGPEELRGKFEIQYVGVPSARETF